MATMIAPTEQRPVRASAVFHLLESTGPLSWAAYLIAIVVAELITSLRSVEAGVAVHLALLFVMPIHATFAPKPVQALLIGLVLAPLIRVVSLAMPLAGLSPVNQYLLTSIPLVVAILVAMQTIGLTRREIGLRFTQPPLQLAIGLLGLPIGALAYAILRPQPLIAEPSWSSAVLPVLVFLLGVGFIEEMLFRGVLQTVARRELGEWGLWFATAVFAALHIGYLSPPFFGLVFIVGLAYAWIAMRTGSFVGVALAHGLTNVVVYLLLPLLVIQGGWALPDVSWSGYTRSGGPSASSAPAASGPAPAPIAVGPTPVSRQAPAGSEQTPDVSSDTPAPPSVAALAPDGASPAEIVSGSPTPGPASALASPVAVSPSASPEPATASASPTASPTPGPGGVIVGPESAANVRAEPSIDADILATVAPGTSLGIVGADRQSEDRTWRNVRLSDGQVGWIDATLVEPAPPEPVSTAMPAPPMPSPFTSPVPEAQAVTDPAGVSQAEANGPVATVNRMYAALDGGDYDTLVSLWSDRMRSLIRLDASQLRARPPSQGLTVRRAELASIDREAGRAVVDVDVTEVVNPGSGVERRYVGSWDLVLGPSGWLLDEPRIRIEE